MGDHWAPGTRMCYGATSITQASFSYAQLQSACLEEVGRAWASLSSVTFRKMLACSPFAYTLALPGFTGHGSTSLGSTNESTSLSELALLPRSVTLLYGFHQFPSTSQFRPCPPLVRNRRRIALLVAEEAPRRRGDVDAILPTTGRSRGTANPRAQIAPPLFLHRRNAIRCRDKMTP